MLRQLQEALNALKGKDIVKNKFEDLLEEELAKLSLRLSDYQIEINDYRIELDYKLMEKKIAFADIHIRYAADKKRISGYGNRIESAVIELTKNIPLYLNVSDASQWLKYNEASRLFDKLETMQQEVIEKYDKTLDIMDSLQEIMELEAYDKETARAARKAERRLRKLY